MLSLIIIFKLCEFNVNLCTLCYVSYKKYPHPLRCSYQVIKDISLVNVDGDECLKLGSLVLSELLGSDVNQGVQHLHEVLVSRCHDL